MCSTCAQAARRRGGEAAAAAPRAPLLDTGAPDTAALAAHNEAYQKGGADAGGADAPTPVHRLPLRALATDPAVLVFMLMHVLAACTPWWVGGPTWRDAALVVASYTARMFGARPRAARRATCGSSAAHAR
jgi:hypothetical protein